MPQRLLRRPAQQHQATCPLTSIAMSKAWSNEASSKVVRLGMSSFIMRKQQDKPLASRCSNFSARNPDYARTATRFTCVDGSGVGRLSSRIPSMMQLDAFVAEQLLCLFGCNGQATPIPASREHRRSSRSKSSQIQPHIPSFQSCLLENVIESSLVHFPETDDQPL